MNFLNKLAAFLPFGKRVEELEYFFALNVSAEKLTVALWTIEGKQLKIIETASEDYSSLDDLETVTDKLLDSVLGIRQIDVGKILFGVPGTWLLDENLKDDYLKKLRELVKELELTPMAYVESANALVHLLEKQEGIPPTAVLVGFEDKHITVTVVRAGKLDGVKIISRGENSGIEIEKALLSFTTVETLPSKILIYGFEKEELEKLRSQLLTFPWMQKLSFLHFPKIDILQDDLEIKSVCLAGATEIKGDVYFADTKIAHDVRKTPIMNTEEPEEEVTLESKESEAHEEGHEESEVKEEETSEEGNLGFVIGDVASHELSDEDENLVVPEDRKLVETEDFEQDLALPPSDIEVKKKVKIKFLFLTLNLTNILILFAILAIGLSVLGAYLFFVKAQVKIFVEPRVLEKDSQVIADPSQKEVNEDKKIIPASIVETEISGTAKENASGQKEIGDPAKGTIVIYNKTNESKSVSKGTTVSSSNSLKFTLDNSVNIASQSATDSGITFGKANTTVTAQAVGADGNLPSGLELTISNISTSQISAKAEGNFSGGTSKKVTIVSSDDQNKLLAFLSSDLRKKAQQALQEKQPDKKILEEALSEQITKKSFNKNVGDQATEVSLNLTAKYKGTTFDDKDLRLFVSKLVTTDVPEGFELKLEDTETQADVSKLEKDGKLIFLARFKAKLFPKIDTQNLKNQIKGKSVGETEKIIKEMDNILGSEVKISPSLPSFLQRLPILTRNINIEVGLK